MLSARDWASLLSKQPSREEMGFHDQLTMRSCGNMFDRLDDLLLELHNWYRDLFRGALLATLIRDVWHAKISLTRTNTSAGATKRVVETLCKQLWKQKQQYPSNDRLAHGWTRAKLFEKDRF